MPAINCLICEYQTDDIDAIPFASQLNIQALTHSAAHSTPFTDKQKPPALTDHLLPEVLQKSNGM